jgi:chromosomal replication initiator protein
MPATHDYWPLVLDNLKTKVSGSNYKAWFSRLEFISTTNQGRKIILGVPSIFNKNYIETRYKEDLKDSISRYFPQVIHIDFHINKDAELPKPAEQAPISLTSVSSRETENTQDGAEKLSTYLPKKNINNLNPKYTFENFVVSDHNDMASNVAKAVVDQPGTLYNPVFIYGGVGLGKTHLMQAVGQKMLEMNPSYNIKYIPSETFLSQFQIALRKGQMEDFKNYYRTIDLLLLDDIQFLAGKESTQSEFFHTFNTLHQLNKQIILTADKQPKDIKGIEERLLSRFEMGMVVDISKPDLESRIAILNDKIERMSIRLTTEQIHTIAETVDTNVRELEGVLNKIQARVIFTPGRDFTDQDLANILSTYELSNRTLIAQKASHTFEKFFTVTCRHFGIEKKDIVGPSRVQNVAHARQYLMWFFEHEMGLSYVSIGKMFGDRDHSTVMHATNKIETLRKTSKQVQDQIDIVKNLAHS